MSMFARVNVLPDCQWHLTGSLNSTPCTKPARYDAPAPALIRSSWGYWCEAHWSIVGNRTLGTGYGQRLLLPNETFIPTDNGQALADGIWLIETYVQWAHTNRSDPDALLTLRTFERERGNGIGRRKADRIADEYFMVSDWRDMARQDVGL
jgi:hypothetical protein